MAIVTRTGVVKETLNAKNPATGNHVYSAKVEYTWTEPNPNPPPAEIEHTETETHLALDESFYRDFQDRVGKSVTTTYEDTDTNRTVSAVKTP